MAYRLDSISMQTDMSPESMAAVTEVWGDIASGKIPLLFDTDGTMVPKLSPVTEYIDYAGVLEGKPYTMVIRTVTPDYFAELEERVQNGELQKYDTAGESIPECSEAAWKLAQEDEQAGNVNIDYSWCLESTVPAEYTPDKKAHCYLYIKKAAA